MSAPHTLSNNFIQHKMILTLCQYHFLFWGEFMKRQTLCLIFGGKSSEYEVSLRSCACILKNIRRDKYCIYKIGISRDGKWYLYLGDEYKIEKGEWVKEKECYPLHISLTDGSIVCGELDLSIYPDVVFPIMHGENCEDGALQGFFDILGLNYIGCKREASVLGINKYLAKLLAKENGIPIAPYFVANSHTSPDILLKNSKKLGFPLYVKASSCGSSVGVYHALSEEELLSSVKKALSFSKTVLIEKEIRGTETEIAVLETNGKIKLGKIGQIRHSGEFYDYEAKYKSYNTELIIPAEITDEQKTTIREYALRIFKAIGGRGLSRVDFFVDGENVIFNEINTMPGFTSGSMYPLLMTGENENISDLIDSILMNEI